MYAFAMLGDEAESALDRLLPALDGRVGVVREATTTTDGGLTRSVRAETEYVVDWTWTASGEGMTVSDAVDRLAVDHDYAVVVGTAAGLPVLSIDEKSAETATETIYRANDAHAFDPDEARVAIEATEPHETLESLVAEIKGSPNADRSGAIATFTGRVRAKESEDDERTRYLEFEKYEGVADRRMRAIESELAERDGVLDVLLHHRTGRIADGEDIVFVVVLAGHRDEAFEAVEDGINRLKDEVPLFKKEVTESETFWVHERE